MVVKRKTQKPQADQASAKKASSWLVQASQLRGDPLGEFTWVTGGRAYVQGSSGNSQPQFGLWFSPARARAGRPRRSR